MSEFTQIFPTWTLVFTTVLYSEAEEKQNMFQRGETIMRIKSIRNEISAVQQELLLKLEIKSIAMLEYAPKQDSEAC